MTRYMVLTPRGPVDVMGDHLSVTDRGDLEVRASDGSPVAAFGAGEWRFCRPSEEMDGNASR